jgi:hypothetical protein
LRDGGLAYLAGLSFKATQGEVFIKLSAAQKIYQKK